MLQPLSWKWVSRLSRRYAGAPDVGAHVAAGRGRVGEDQVGVQHRERDPGEQPDDEHRGQQADQALRGPGGLGRRCVDGRRRRLDDEPVVAVVVEPRRRRRDRVRCWTGRSCDRTLFHLLVEFARHGRVYVAAMTRPIALNPTWAAIGHAEPAGALVAESEHDPEHEQAGNSTGAKWISGEEGGRRDQGQHVVDARLEGLQDAARDRPAPRRSGPRSPRSARAPPASRRGRGPRARERAPPPCRCRRCRGTTPAGAGRRGARARAGTARRSAARAGRSAEPGAL